MFFSLIKRAIAWETLQLKSSGRAEMHVLEILKASEGQGMHKGLNIALETAPLCCTLGVV